MMKRCILILLLMPLAFASGCIASTFNNILTGDTGMMIGAVVVLTILAITLSFMIGRVTNNAEAIVFAKDEAYHLGFSAVMIAGIAFLMFFSCQSVSFFLDFALGPSGINELGSAGSCYTGLEAPSTIATCYLSSIRQSTDTLLKQDIKQSFKAQMESTATVAIYNPVTGGVVIPWNAYRKADSLQLDLGAMSFALPALVSLNMQIVILNISTDILRWLLPLALVLRAMPLTRNLGNLWIAVSIALYIILPTIYAIDGAMDHLVAGSCSRYSDLVSDPVFGGCSSETSFWALARAIPQAFFLPNLALAMVTTFLAGVSKALKVIG